MKLQMVLHPTATAQQRHMHQLWQARQLIVLLAILVGAATPLLLLLIPGVAAKAVTPICVGIAVCVGSWAVIGLNHYKNRLKHCTVFLDDTSLAEYNRGVAIVDATAANTKAAVLRAAAAVTDAAAAERTGKLTQLLHLIESINRA